MNNQCDLVVFSNKAYNGIIRESFAKHPVETGGILLGYILDNGAWIVMEMVPPGLDCVHEVALFEYDRDFVNYLGTSIANQYKRPLQVLGLWHRHPGSMDFFSSTDDVTNSDFASRNPCGVISGLVNIDPKLRLTMYYLGHTEGTRPKHVAYTKVDVEIGDDLIPEKYFELRYVDAEHTNLNPAPPVSNSKNTAVQRSASSSDKQPIETGSEDKQFNIPAKIEATNKVRKSKSKARFIIAIIALGCFALGFASGYWIWSAPAAAATVKDDAAPSESISGEEVTAPSQATVRQDGGKSIMGDTHKVADDVKAEPSGTINDTGTDMSNNNQPHDRDE